MNAPPTKPPMEFRYQKWNMASTIASFIGGFALLLWCLFDLALHARQGRSYGFDVFCVILISPMVLLNAISIFNRLGGRLELRDGMIRTIRWNGSVWQQAYLHNAVSLVYVVPNGETIPSLYMLKYPKFAIYFRHDIENVEMLIAEIESRTNKRFQLAVRN